MNLTTTRKKRLAGVAALAFGGAVLLGACDGEGAFPLCDTLDSAIQDLDAQIANLEDQIVEEGSLEEDLVDLQLRALREVRDFKQDQFEANCESVPL